MRISLPLAESLFQLHSFFYLQKYDLLLSKLPMQIKNINNSIPYWVRICFFYVVIILILFAPVFFFPKGTMLFGEDIFRYHFFNKTFSNTELLKGTLPLWNPYSFSGLPFFANMDNSLFYLPDKIYAYFDIKIAYPLYLMFHILLAMCGMYLLLRLKLEKSAAWFGGLVYGLNGYFLANIYAGHAVKISNGSWMPVVLYFFLISLQTKRIKPIVFTIFSLVLQYLSGYPIIVLFTLITMTIAALFTSISRKSLRPLLIFSIIVMLTFTTASLSFLPNSQYLRQSVRSLPLPYAWLSIGSLEWKHLVEYVDPFRFGDQKTYNGAWQYYTERIGFFGRLPLALACIGFFVHLFKRKNIFAFIGFFSLLFGLWVSLGYTVAPFDLNRFLFTFVSLYHAIRIPTRHIILVVFGGSILASLGFSIVKNKLVQVCIAAVTILEMVSFGWHFMESKPFPVSQFDQRLVNIIEKQNDLVRVLPNFNWGERPRLALDFQSSLYYPYFSATGYDPQMLKNYYEFIDAMSGNEKSSITSLDVQIPYIPNSSPWIDFLNIKYLITPLAYGDNSLLLKNKFTLIADDWNRYFFQAFENTTYAKRFFFVKSALKVDSEEQVLAKLKDASFHPTTEILLSRQSNPAIDTINATCSSLLPNVTVISYDINTIVLATHGECSAYLVTSEVMYPGWEATIDNKPSEILTANHAFRSLFIPKGIHTVAFTFRPTIFYIGLIISTALIIILLISLVFERVLIKHMSKINSQLLRL